MIDPIYTSGDNRAYAALALAAHFLVGIRSDKSPYHDLPIQFVDINYACPDWSRHLKVVNEFRPRYATVPDLSETQVSQVDIDRALRQADQLAKYCDVPLIIPKLAGQLAFLPVDVAIGFSVVSRYGGVQSVEFELLPMLQGRRVHLLGGSPHRQMEMYRYISCYARVVSADGNMFQLMSGRGKYWHKGKWIRHPSAGQEPRNPHVVPECLAWSLSNIRHSWQAMQKEAIAV
jgi:hypothetical protein